MITLKTYRQFHRTHCRQCGHCLTACPYMTLSHETAIREIQQLQSGHMTPRMLKECVGCMACNGVCPKGLKPYDLMVLCWYDRYQEQELPIRVSYLTPHGRPHFRSDLVRHLGPRHRRMVQKWRHARPDGGRAFYPGCNLLALPQLLNTPLLSDLTIIGDWNLCCGEMYYRLGALDAVKAIARSLTHYFHEHPVEELMVGCPACYRMLTKILPERFETALPTRITFFAHYIKEEMMAHPHAHSLEPEGRVGLHHPCHTRLNPNPIQDDLLAFLNAINWHPVMWDRGAPVCCGAAAGANRHHLTDMARVARKTLIQAKKAGIKTLVTYCAGCQLHFSLWRWSVPGAPTVRHFLELATRAIGHDVRPKLSFMTHHLVKTGLRRLLPRYLSPRRFTVETHLPPTKKRDDSGFSGSH